MTHHHLHGHDHHHCEKCHHEHSECPCCSHAELCELHHHQEHEDFSHQLIELADQAWMEVLHEKIKQQIEATSGKHLERLAKLVAESNKNRWKNKLGLQKNTKDFKEKVSEFFNKE